MGLDMYAHITTTDIPDVDFQYPEGNGFRIAYWCKHPNLHGWMQDLYYRKGGSNPDFNCATLRLTLDDLAKLEQAVNADALPETTGFFFGKSHPEDKAYDLAFIERARKAVHDGYQLFYYAWW